MSKPTNYRRALCTRILTALHKGESVALIGVGSSGKSNVAQHIVRPDVIAACLNADAEGMLGVLINCMKDETSSATALYRLMLQSLSEAVRGAGAPAGLSASAPAIAQLLEKAFESEQPDRVRFHLEQAIDRAFADGAQRVFFVLDDFDHTLRTAPGQALNTLRAFRDRHKNHLTFVTVTRKELAFLRDEREYEDFAEIVTSTTIPVGMFAWPDAHFVIDELITRWNLHARIDATGKNNIIEWSGSHPGLIKAIVNIANRNNTFDFSARATLEKLYGHKDTIPECEKIWDSLEEEEQQVMIAVISGAAAERRLIGRLVNKELLRHDARGAIVAFSPIFEHYVREYKQPPRAATHTLVELDGRTLQIRIDGRRILDVDEIEYRLFKCIYDRRPAPVTDPELYEAMMAGDISRARIKGPPLQRLERYLTLLLEKVNLPQRAYLIRNGRGCAFAE